MLIEKSLMPAGVAQFYFSRFYSYEENINPVHPCSRHFELQHPKK